MKTIKLALIIFIAGSVSIFAQKKDVDIKKSSVKWTGKKIGGSHDGKILIKSGYFDFENGKITRGEVVIDMSTITVSDIENSDYNKKLVGHLKSEDFFGTEKHPTSSFTVTKATKFNNGKASISGKITIKGKTEELTFDVKKEDNVYKAQLKLDRSKFDVRYGSKSFFNNLGDKVIDDIFILDIKLVME